MGHLRLGQLPKTRNWRQVVALIEGGAGTAEIAGATFNAAEKHLQSVSPGLLYSFWLLTQIPQAAKQENFAQALNEIGIKVRDNPDLMELVGGFTDAVDDHFRRGKNRSDLDEMAQMAMAESLHSLGVEPTLNLFKPEFQEVKETLKKYSTRDRFGVLARDFFSRLLNRYLSNFLSKELSNHIGQDRRFINLKQHSEFNAALELHCRQASRIVEDFSGGWYSKANFEGGITPEKATRFLYHALSKLRSELKIRGDGDEQ